MDMFYVEMNLGQMGECVCQNQLAGPQKSRISYCVHVFLGKSPINVELWLMIHRNIGVKCTCVGNLVGNASKSMTDFKKRLIEGIDEYVIKQT